MIIAFDYVTNDTKAAKAFRRIDAQYAKDREAAKNLPLAAKIEALRAAKQKQVTARRQVIAALVCVDQGFADLCARLKSDGTI